MSYRTILAYAETESDLHRVMPVAMAVAKDHGAHVIGLHVIRNERLAMHTPYQIDVIVDAEARLRAEAEKRAEAMGASFEAIVAGEVGVVGEWRAVHSPTTDVHADLIDHARCCDLVIMGQPDAEADLTNRLGTLGEAILQTGRPVLVVPYAWEARSLGKRVFVAWNGSREGTRALFDAMPLLQGASEVRLFGVSKNDGETLPGAALATTLSRHGINAVTETSPPTQMSVADTLLSRLADHGSDLLVMGGYGRSRAREYVFGGATRDILKTMTVPVLFSH